MFCLASLHKSRLASARRIALLAGLFVSGAEAHGPFDHSARLMVQETQLELTVTVGMDAAAVLFRDHPEALLQRGPTGRYPMSPPFMERVGEFAVDGVVLVPESLFVHAEPLEVAISAVYPRKQLSKVAFTPRYLSLSDHFEPGVMEVADENGNRLGAARLTRSGQHAEVSIGVSLPPAAAADGLSAAPVQTSVGVSNPAAPHAAHSQNRPGIPVFVLGLGMAALVVVVWACIRQSKWKTSKS